MKDFFIYGLQRSGNHYFIEHLLHNLSGGKLHEMQPFQWGPHGIGLTLERDKIRFVNNVSRGPNTLHPDAGRHHPQYKYNVFSLENPSLKDMYPHICKNRGSSRDIVNIIVQRDILNMLASRQRGAQSLGHSPFSNTPPKEWIDKYLQFCRESLGETDILENKICVNYNEHISSKTYRDEICKKLNIKNYELKKSDSRIGGSMAGKGSFGPNQNYNERYKGFKYNDDNLEIITHPEVAEKTKEIFGISFNKDSI